MQRQVLEGKLAVAADEVGEESKQEEQERDHRAGIVFRAAPADQPLGWRLGFGEAQVYRADSVSVGSLRSQTIGDLLP